MSMLVMFWAEGLYLLVQKSKSHIFYCPAEVLTSPQQHIQQLPFPSTHPDFQSSVHHPNNSPSFPPSIHYNYFPPYLPIPIFPSFFPLALKYIFAASMQSLVRNANRYLGKLKAIKIQKNFSMINFEDFQVDASDRLPLVLEQAEAQCQPISLEHQLSTHQTPHSIHETAIEEIEDLYSSIQHSANILDRIYRCQLGNQEDGEDQLQGRQNSEECKLRKRMERRLKNQTKNIPKNFGKGIISFIERNDQKVKSLLSKNGVNYHDFLAKMKVEKKIINTIADLRRLWTDPIIGRCMRIISNVFFRKHALNYIFNSRISNYSSHVKYRQSLWMALRSPESFNRIKQY